MLKLSEHSDLCVSFTRDHMKTRMYWANEILKQNNYLITDTFGTDKQKEYSCKNVKLTSMETAV